MKKFGKRLFLITLVALCLVVYSCGEKNTPDVEPGNGFDKTAMLTYYADNLIIPGYVVLQQRFQTLETALTTFLNAPTEANQQALKPVFKEAYLHFQRVEVYQVGPAETALFSNFLNTFPADAVVVEKNIKEGTYNLALNSSTTQQGFPALDYLLFAPDALQKFNQEGHASRKKYTLDVMNRMKALAGTVITGWNNGYRTQFIGNTRTDVGSPIGFLVNQLAFGMDQLKGPRIGWPYGKQSGGIVFADKSEAYYAGFSAALALENLTSLRNAYTGNESGKGISDYLIALKKEKLNTDILAQFDTAITKLKAVPDPLATAFTGNKDLVDATYREIQSLLTLIKTDLASATGVRITYQDSDGD